MAITTTYIREVAERMTDRIGIIAGGRLMAPRTLQEVREQAGKSLTCLKDTFPLFYSRTLAA